MATGLRWNYEIPDTKNRNLSALLYEHALKQGEVFEKWHRDQHIYECHPGEYTPQCPLCHPRATWRQKLAWWWRDHRPHVHLGPCPREE